MVFDGRITGVSGKCARGDRRQLDVTATVAMELMRGPAMRGRAEDVPFFVAVTEGRAHSRQAGLPRRTPTSPRTPTGYGITSEHVSLALPIEPGEIGGGLRPRGRVPAHTRRTRVQPPARAALTSRPSVAQWDRGDRSSSLRPGHPARESAGRSPPPKAQPAPGNAQAPRTAPGSTDLWKAGWTAAVAPHRRSKERAPARSKMPARDRGPNLSGSATEGGRRAGIVAGARSVAEQPLVENACLTIPRRRRCRRRRSTRCIARSARAWCRSRATRCRCSISFPSRCRPLPGRHHRRAPALPSEGRAVRRLPYGAGRADRPDGSPPRSNGWSPATSSG